MIKNKRGAVPFAVAIIGLIVITLFASNQLGFSPASITGSGNYIERPVFKYLKCEAIGGLKYSTDYSVSSSGTWANKPSVSSSYNLRVDFDVGGITSKRFSYSVCNSRVESESNCRVFKNVRTITNGQTLEINNIKENEEVRLYLFEPAQVLNAFREKGVSGASYQIGFVPYGLREYNVLSGSSSPVNPNSCEVPSSSDSWRDRYISSDADKIRSQVSKNTNERSLQPEEVRYYVSGYVTSASPTFELDYKGKDAWCRSSGNSAEIYEVNTIQLGSGNYRVASVDWSDKLGNELCCPGDTRGDETCSNNFKWESIKGAECSIINSCGSPNFVPYSEGELIKYSCVSGFCEQEIRKVECSSDFDCQDSNELCDLNSYECVDANVNIKGQLIETIPDNRQDCEAKSGTWITKQEVDRSFLNVVSLGYLGSETIVTEEYCDLNSFDLFFWLFWIGIAVMIYFFRGQILAGIKPVLKFLRLA